MENFITKINLKTKLEKKIRDLFFDPNKLSQKIILENLDERAKIIIYKIIGSTNTEAKKMLENFVERGTILIANAQTAGRGRGNKQFYSPKNSGIYMSIILKPNVEMEKGALITMATAVAICDVIEKLFDLEPKIKWVNDIFLDGKKVGGILTESITSETEKIESVIIGIGINFTTENFPDNIKNIAGAISSSPKKYSSKNKTSDKTINRNYFIAEIINEVKKITDNIFQNIISKDELIKKYKSLSNILGKKIVITNSDGKTEEALAIDIDGDGHLIVELEKNRERKVLVFGDVSIKI
ncbi:MAG: biotin--[acetyl-CoA-carboxylase] ligase [Fusobacteriaceae bacterium]